MHADDLLRGPSPKRAAAVGVAVLVVLGVAGAAFVALRGEESPSLGTENGGEAEPAPLVDPTEIREIVPRDAIPALDEPRFAAVDDVDFLQAREPVIEVEIDGDARAYPLQILTWHEIVNDTVGGTPVTVTFCPLCNTAIAFERPTIEGETTTFGTSGSLYNSNLVMYDRATESYWPQATGQAVMGPLTGEQLERVPAQIVSWSDFREAYPNGKVLTRDTGHNRDYGTNPYPGYDDIDNPPFLFEGEVDGRLAAVERVLGVQTEDESVAFPYFRLRAAAKGELATVNTKVGDRPTLILWKAGVASALDETEIATSKEVGGAGAFDRELGGRTLRFEVRDGRVVDRATASVWNIFGRAVSGPLKVSSSTAPTPSTPSGSIGPRFTRTPAYGLGDEECARACTTSSSRRRCPVWTSFTTSPAAWCGILTLSRTSSRRPTRGPSRRGRHTAGRATSSRGWRRSVST